MVRKPRTTTTHDLIDAAMVIAARDGWHAITMTAVADEVGIALDDARAICVTTNSTLNALLDHVDRNALEERAHFQDDDTVRDRLFALLMARLDALLPYKPAFTRLAKYSVNNTAIILLYLPRFMSSMALMLETAGVPPTGPMGVLRTKALSLLYGNAFKVWLNDDSPDMAETMATMDKGLERAEMLAMQFTPRQKPD